MDKHVTQFDRPSPPDAATIFQRLDEGEKFPYSRKEYLGRMLWRIVECTLFRFSPPRAYAWRRWLLSCFGAKLAKVVGVRPSVHIMHPWLLEMGHSSILGVDVVVYNLGPVSIGSQTSISQGTYLCAGTHDYTRPELPLQRMPIRIGNGVWVAAQAFVGPGVTIGDNCVIGARAVVAKDVEPWSVAVGNPARVVKRRAHAPAAGGSESP